MMAWNGKPPGTKRVFLPLSPREISSVCFPTCSVEPPYRAPVNTMLYAQNITFLGALLLLTQASTTLAHPARHIHHHKHHLARDVGAKHHQIRVPADTSEALWSNHSTHRPLLRKRGGQDNSKEGKEEGKTFTIRQVKNPRLEKRSTAQRNGLSALIHAYAKYGVEPSPRIKKGVKLNPAFREYREQLEKSM